MNRRTIIALFASALLASTAAAEAQGIPSNAPQFTLTGTAGITAFNVPSFGTGYFGHNVDGALVGGMIGANLTGTIGHQGGWDVVLGMSGFASWANGSDSFTDALSGSGTVTITGLSAPAGGPGGPSSIVLSVAAPNVSAVVVNNNPQGGGSSVNSTSAGATTNTGAVQGAAGGDSFVLGVVASSGAPSGSAASGAIADTSGGIFLATGDLTGVDVTTSVKRSIGYGGADLTVGLAGSLNSTMGVQFYAGPSFRVLEQTNTTKVSVSMPTAGVGSPVTFPTFSISRSDDLSSRYWGGVLGTSLAFLVSPGMQFTLGAEGGLYDIVASWNGHSTYSTCCGNFTGAPGGASPSLSVNADPSSFSFSNALGIAARGNAGLTFAIGGSKALTLGGNIEYLSKVAEVNHAGLGSITTPGGTASFDSTKSTPIGAPTFSWGHMINYGASVSLTGSF